MSVRVMAAVWQHSRATGGELLVALALADFANDAAECWPSIPVLTQKARLTERRVQRVLDKLERLGEVRVDRSNGGRNLRNHYFITPPDTLTPVSPALNHQRTIIEPSERERKRATALPQAQTGKESFQR
jgi:hypothetical protein